MANRRSCASAWLAAACLLLAALWPFAASAQRAAFEHSTDRLIVKWKQGSAGHAQILAARDHRVSPQQLSRLAGRAGVSLTAHRAMSGNAQVLRLPGRRSLAEARAIAARLAEDPEVEFAVPDQRRFPAASPNDPLYVAKLQKNLERLNLPAAWDVTTGDPALVVAVIDTGILAHPDLAGRVLPGYDFVAETYLANDGGGRDAGAADPGDWVSPSDVADMNSPFDAACLYGGLYESPSSWHGTHMAGIIAANGNNQLGVAGINWGSKILPVRVLGKCGGFDSDVIDGMRWAAGLAVPNAPANPNPARVLNMSLGGPGVCNAAYQSAVDEIVALGKVIVTAAGNERVDFKTRTPASCQGVLAAAAFALQAGGTFFESFGQSFYSNYGTAADTNLFALPGDAIWSTSDAGARDPVNSGSYLYEYGTSGAAAHLSGLVSLMLSAKPALTPAEVQQQLRAASVSLGDWSGSGKPDALQAVGNALAYPGPVKTPSSLAVNGPATFFEDRSAAYTATVTWSDASTSQVYPAWSMDAGATGVASISSTGVLSGGGISADRAMTVQASFTMNGVTVTAGKPVTMLDNHIVSLAIAGPDTINLNNPSPAKFALVVTWADGSVFGGDLTGTVTEGAWSATSGAISQAGFFTPAAPGAVTISVSDAGVNASKDITVENVTPGSSSFAWSCASESTAGLTLSQVNYLDVGSSGNIVPLCDGRALVADNVANRIDVIDARAGVILKSWSFADRPYRMELAPGTSKLFVTFLNSGQVARVDLATDLIDVLTAVTGTAAYVGSGEDGQVWVLHAPSAPSNASLTRYDVATGNRLDTFALEKPALHFKYSKPQQILVTTDFSQRTSYNFNPAAPAFVQREFLFDAGGLLSAMSPDGTRALINGKDLDAQALTSSRGAFGASAAGYSPDGRQVAGNLANADNDIAVYNAATHVQRRLFPKPFNCPYWGYQFTGFSPTGAYIYGYEQCGIDGSYGRLFWIPVKAEPVPDPIAFDAQTGVAPGALATSNTVTLGGYAGTASIGVAGGEYSLDGQPFTAAAGTAIAGQTVTVRATASGQAYATAKATLNVGEISAEFLVTTGAPLAAQWWNPSCGAEADLGAPTVKFLDIDPAWDIVALCDGRLLAGNRRLNRVELYDLRAGAVVKSWQLKATPEALKRVPGTSILLVVTDASRLARVDLATGQVGEILVGGRPFDAAPGEAGQVFVASQALPKNNTIEGDTITVHDIATGAELSRQFLDAGIRATLLRYDAARKTLLLGDGSHSPARVSRYNYTPGSHALALAEYNLDVVGSFAHDLVLSPDGTRLAYPGEGGVPDLPELDPLNLSTPRGKWASGPWPRAADFRGDGAKLLVGSEKDSRFVNGIELFDVATRALEKYWLLPHCDPLQGKVRRVRLSPSGGYAFALETCGSFNGDSARLHWIRTDAAGTMPRPDAVSFVSQTGAPLNSDINSNVVTITGLGGAWLPISVDNGGYEVGFGTGFTTVNGFVKDGDEVRVRNTAWFATGVTTTTTLNIGGTLLSFDVTTGSGADVAPNPFQLMTLKNQAPGTLFVSNTITVSGINAPAPISVVGGDYSINGGAFTSAAGTVTSGQTVAVRVTSPGVLNSANSAILTVGNASSAFTVATGAFDNTPDDFTFASRKQPARNAWVESAPLTVTGLGGPALASVAGGELRVGAGTFRAAPAVVQPGDTVKVRVKSGASFGATSIATLAIGTRSGSFSTTVSVPINSDFNADGKSDLFWLHTDTNTFVWQMNGAGLGAGTGPVQTVGDAQFQVKGIGDFDGDGKADVLWMHTDGRVYVWLMNGTIPAASYIATVVGDWAVQGVGDFDGDGKADVLWRNSSSGDLFVWLMNGAGAYTGVYIVATGLPLTSTVGGIGDFNGDGKADVLFKDGVNTSVWLTTAGLGTFALTSVAPLPNTSWQVKGVGDFNGDGKSDVLVMEPGSGTVYVWFMNGAAVSFSYVATVVGPWTVQSVGDYNGDGKADVFWRNGATTLVWLNNGSGTSFTYAPVAVVNDLNWNVQNPK